MQFWGDVSDRLTLVAILRQLPGATAKQVGNRWSIYIPKKEGR